MIQVLSVIGSAAKLFEARPYFRLLEGSGTLSDVATVVSGSTFLVFAFQDMLRLNQERMQDPQLRKLAREHRRGDAGHELWFVNDMKKLGVERDIPWLFSKAHRTTRDASFQLICEVLRADDDRQRIAVPLVLEAGAAAFFSRAFGFFERCGVEQRLEYFAKSHWDAEQDHEMFEAQQEQLVESIAMDDSTRRLTIDMVHRMFAALTLMVDGIHSEITAQRARRADLRAVDAGDLR